MEKISIAAKKIEERFNNRGLILSAIGLLIISLTLRNALAKMRLSGETSLNSFFEKLTSEGHLEGYVISFGVGFMFFFAGLMAAYTFWKLGYER